MNAIDQLRHTHRRAQVATALETAGRELCDILTGDDLEGEELYDAIEAAVARMVDTLGGGPEPEPEVEASDEGQDLEVQPDRLPPPEPITTENTRQRVDCNISGKPIKECRCNSCRAHRGETIPTPAATGARRTCRGCDETKPVSEFNRSGGGLLWTCKPCMADKQQAAQARRRAAAAREPSDGKEPV